MIDKILSYLGVPTRAPPRVPARRLDLHLSNQNCLPPQADGAARYKSEFFGGQKRN